MGVHSWELCNTHHERWMEARCLCACAHLLLLAVMLSACYLLQAVFAANAVAITASPHLWVCIGGRLHPWSSAAPAVRPFTYHCFSFLSCAPFLHQTREESAFCMQVVQLCSCTF